VTEFVKKIRSVDYDKIPEPFFPIYGQLYESAPTRIAFVGMETRGWGNMTDFVKAVDENPEDAIFRGFEEFNELEFCKWGNNSGNSFWDFNFKFLANFHGIDDWKKVKQGETEEILKSFAWGNTNSIERYEVTAKEKGVAYENWLTVKEASKCFDRGKYLLDILQPHLMVILNWDTSEEWLINGVDNFSKEEVDEHFWYYFIPTTKTHVIWTAHPTWLAKNTDFDSNIKYLVNFIKQRL
jgi:hypothetical protein